MRTRLASLFVIFCIFAVARPVDAAIYFDQVRYNRSLTSSVRNPSTPTSRCLYYNAQGICMIEQFIDPSNYNPDRYRTYPRYDRDYLSRERRYSNRYDDDEYDRYYDWSYDDEDYYDFDFDEFLDGDDDDDDDDC